MDMIYTNAKREDLGVLHDYEMDLAFGADENDFECTVSVDAHCCEPGSYLYVEGTEYGGIVDGIQSRSAEKEVVYSGRTWHGILGSKVILPLQSGETAPAGVTIKTTDSTGASLAGRYLIISGDANDCLRFIIDRCGLSAMFTAVSVPAGVTITNHQFNRFTDAYSGVMRMLASVNHKLHLEYSGGAVVLSAVPIFDYSQADEFDSDVIDFEVSKAYKTVNHLVCLGKGELENRLVVHLYADASGNISRTQTFFGVDEYTATFDYSNAESEEELIGGGTDRLKELWAQDSVAVDFDETADAYNVGDIVGAVDNVTGLAISATVTKKIVKIRNGKITIDLSTDTMSASGGNATGNGTVSGGGGNSGASLQEIMLAIYPVGAIYTSTVETNPGTLFGGTWQRIQDTFLLAAGSSYAAGSTGGEATHTLTVAEMPSHGHSAAITHGDGEYTSEGITATLGYVENGYRYRQRMSATGGGAAHNNMPPYLAVFVWKRTA